MLKKFLLLILSLSMLTCTEVLHAKTYSSDNLPMVYTLDKTRHVINPDGILSSHTVAEMDDMLNKLETEKGVQSIVAVVKQVEDGDCYNFCMQLGNKLGVGSKENTGLIVLLSTQDRCYQILTGEGLEGTLPDAICRRIENRQMVPYLKQGDWDNAMLQTIAAVCGVIQNDTSLINTLNDKQKKENSSTMYLMIGFMALIFVISHYVNKKRNTCQRCKKGSLIRINSQRSIDRIRMIEHHIEYYQCPKCGHTICRTHDEPFDNGTGLGGFPPIIGPFHRGIRGGYGSRGFNGGSFGGGSFGGGGAGGKF